MPGSPTTASALARTENSKQFLRDNPEIAEEIELAIRQNAGLIADAIIDPEGGAEESGD